MFTENRSMSWKAWTIEEDRLLRANAGYMEAARLVDIINTVSVAPRTVGAIYHRAWRLGLTLDRKYFTMRDLVRLFKTHRDTIKREWIDQKLIHARRATSNKPSRNLPLWVIMDADVESFIREYPWAYDWRKIKRGRLRSVAEMVNRSDPWLNLHEVSASIHLSRHRLYLWLKQGLVPFKRRYSNKYGGPDHIMVRVKDLGSITCNIEMARREKHAASFERLQAANRERIAKQRGEKELLSVV